MGCVECCASFVDALVVDGGDLLGVFGFDFSNRELAAVLHVSIFCVVLDIWFLRWLVEVCWFVFFSCSC